MNGLHSKDLAIIAAGLGARGGYNVQVSKNHGGQFFMEKIKERLNKTQLITLFMVCAFPIHLWTLVLVLRDLNWIATRTDMWDAIGVGGYAMLYAFVGSIVFFLMIATMYFLLPARWGSDKVLALSGLIALLIPFWVGVKQIYRHLDFGTPGFLVEILFDSGHPLRYFIIGVGVLAILIIGAIALPVYLIVLKQGVEGSFISFFERLSTLTGLYLFMDLIGLIIVIFRNVS